MIKWGSVPEFFFTFSNSLKRPLQPCYNQLISCVLNNDANIQIIGESFVKKML